jgi:single-stranded DNA-binding protein
VSSINKVILVGNLGADPKIRRTQDGRAMANLRLATADSYNITSTYFDLRTVRINFHFRFRAARRYQCGLYLQYSSDFLSHFIKLGLNRSYVFPDSNCIPCQSCRDYE